MASGSIKIAGRGQRKVRSGARLDGGRHENGSFRGEAAVGFPRMGKSLAGLLQQ
jgi:hypothetical protein